MINAINLHLSSALCDSPCLCFLCILFPSTPPLRHIFLSSRIPIVTLWTYSGTEDLLIFDVFLQIIPSP